MGRVRDMLNTLFGRKALAPPPAPPCPDCGLPDAAKVREDKIKEMADHAHALARRVHVLEWQTMPNFEEIAEQARKREERSDD